MPKPDSVVALVFLPLGAFSRQRVWIYTLLVPSAACLQIPLFLLLSVAYNAMMVLGHQKSLLRRRFFLGLVIVLP